MQHCIPCRLQVQEALQPWAGRSLPQEGGLTCAGSHVHHQNSYAEQKVRGHSHTALLHWGEQRFAAFAVSSVQGAACNAQVLSCHSQRRRHNVQAPRILP